MRLVTIEQARVHCKADGDDDDVLEIYVNAAESLCARLANRSLFATAAERDAALATVQSRMTAAYAVYDGAIDSAEAVDDDRLAGMLKAAATAALDRVTLQCEYDLHGIVLPEANSSVGGMTGEEAIHAAVLMATAHFYATRPGVITGQGASAIEVPMGVHDIMTNFRWIGP